MGLGLGSCCSSGMSPQGGLVTLGDLGDQITSGSAAQREP